MSDKTICGLSYEIQAAGPVHPKSERRGKPRIIVQGIMHPKGELPIRFKSVEAAENHIRNLMKVGK